MNIHTYITKNIKNNFLNYNYNKIRLYRLIIDTGPLICELNNNFRKDYIYE